MQKPTSYCLLRKEALTLIYHRACPSITVISPKRLPNHTTLTATVFVGTVTAVLLAVTEEAALDAVAVAAGQEALLAQWLVGVQERLDLALFALQLAVLHRILPVARLLLNVKVQTGRASDRLQTLKYKRVRGRTSATMLL